MCDELIDKDYSPEFLSSDWRYNRRLDEGRLALVPED